MQQVTWDQIHYLQKQKDMVIDKQTVALSFHYESPYCLK